MVADLSPYIRYPSVIQESIAEQVEADVLDALDPGQAITLEEAIPAFTTNPAEAAGIGDVAGRLTVGRSADLVVLDRDLFAIGPTDIHRTRAVRTYFQGRASTRRSGVDDHRRRCPNMIGVRSTRPDTLVVAVDRSAITVPRRRGSRRSRTPVGWSGRAR